MTAERKARVLVLDDDESLRRAFARQLSAAAFDVDQAATGTEALKLFERLQRLARLEREALEALGNAEKLIEDRAGLEGAVKQKLVGSLTALCHELGMRVVAEGVETAAERDQVVALGADLLQGCLFAKPGPPFPSVAW